MAITGHSFKSETENSVSSAEKSELNSPSRNNMRLGAFSSGDVKKPRTSEGQ